MTNEDIKEMYGFIYLTTNNINGKQYVGMCTHENPIKSEGNQYLGSGKIIKLAIKKYNKEAFTRTILEVCSSLDQLLLSEIKWIQEKNPEYNIESGGRGGISDRLLAYWATMTADERKVARNWNTDHSSWSSPEYSCDMSQVQLDVWANRSIEEREKISNKTSKTRKERGVAKGERNPMYGRSAIREKNLKWYTNGKENKYITEGTNPSDFVRGRTNFSGKIGRKK